MWLCVRSSACLVAGTGCGGGEGSGYECAPCAEGRATNAVLVDSPAPVTFTNIMGSEASESCDVWLGEHPIELEEGGQPIEVVEFSDDNYPEFSARIQPSDSSDLDPNLYSGSLATITVTYSPVGNSPDEALLLIDGNPVFNTMPQSHDVELERTEDHLAVFYGQPAE